MLGWLRKAREAVQPDCTPESPRGTHGTLVGNLGMMQDAICRLRCGRDRYEEQWTREEIARAIPVHPGLWDELERAQKLRARTDRGAVEEEATPGMGPR